MAKQLLTPLRLIARMNFLLKNYSCELLNLTRTVGKVELISTFKADSHVAVYRYNTTSDQWSYLHKSIIFLVIILTFKYILLRLMKKYLSPVINRLLCCVNWYSRGVIRSSHHIRTRSHRIRIVVKFYKNPLRLRYGRIPTRYYPPLVLF